MPNLNCADYNSDKFYFLSIYQLIFDVFFLYIGHVIIKMFVQEIYIRLFLARHKFKMTTYDTTKHFL